MTGLKVPATPDPAALAGMLVALGVGLLIGAERERRKQQRPATAGIRTFTLAALSGAVAAFLAGGAGLTVVTAVVGLMAAVGAWAGRRSEDPGLTTEVALVLTALLGGLAMSAPALAGMLGAVVAILLAARSPLHRFVGNVLTEREVADGLVLAGATLVVLPLLPDRAMGPFEVLNPREIWLLVILLLGVGAAGHAAVRLVGARFGLPLAGFLSGFVSSTATIAAMGARSRATPEEAAASAAAAVLSTVATLVQLALILAAVSPPALTVVGPSLAAGGVVAVLFGAASTVRALARPAAVTDRGSGAAFSPLSALVFAATVSVVLLAAAAARILFGDAGVSVTAVLAGLADAHVPAISVATLVAEGKLTPDVALFPILLGLTANTAVKVILAGVNGGRAFLFRVGPGLLLVACAVWAPLVMKALA